MLYYFHSFQTMGRKEYFHDYMMIYADRHAYMVYQLSVPFKGKWGISNSSQGLHQILI